MYLRGRNSYIGEGKSKRGVSMMGQGSLQPSGNSQEKTGDWKRLKKKGGRRRGEVASCS